MSAITTHVLDVSLGRPAAGVGVVLRSRNERGEYTQIGQGATDADGRLRTLLATGQALEPGLYEMTFDTGAYHRSQGVEGFYPLVTVAFTVAAAAGHYHVPLLLSPFGYSTYRGS